MEKEGKESCPTPSGEGARCDQLAAMSRLRFKIDMHIIPTVAIMYLLCFIDRTNVGNARLAGMEKSLGLKGNDFNVLLSVFYIAYLAFELPSSVMCKRVGPRVWLPLITFAFGLFSLCTSFVQGKASAMVVRFLLGAAEAGQLPGTAYYLSRWYTRDELTCGYAADAPEKDVLSNANTLPVRMAMYIVSAPLSGAFGGLLASALLRIQHFGYFQGWRSIFFVEGLVTMFVGVAAFCTLTTCIDSATWLSDEEKQLATNRLTSESVATVHVLDAFRRRQLLAGVLNPTSLVGAVMFLGCNITVQGFSFFMPTIVRSLYPGRTIIQQQLLTVPPYFCAALSVLAVAYLSMKIHRRGSLVVAVTLLVITGFAMHTAYRRPAVAYAGSFLIAIGAFPCGALLPSWGAANCNSDSARVGSIGSIALLGNLGGIISCWTYLPSNAPHFVLANALNLASSALMVFLASALSLYLQRENAKRERAGSDAPLASLSLDQQEQLGHQHPAFRFHF